LKPDAKVKEHHPEKTLLDKKIIAQAVWECLEDNDPEGVIEVIEAHLEAVNKQQKAVDVKLPRSTLYSSLKGRNPTIKTLAKMINCFS
jgi:DNA-binding phage protein